MFVDPVIQEGENGSKRNGKWNNGRKPHAGQHGVCKVGHHVGGVQDEAFAQNVGFSLSNSAIIAFGLLRSDLPPLYPAWDVQEVLDGLLERQNDHEDLGIVSKVSWLEVLAGVPVQNGQQQGRVEETSKREFEGKRNVHFGLCLVVLSQRENLDHNFQCFVDDCDTH